MNSKTTNHSKENSVVLLKSGVDFGEQLGMGIVSTRLSHLLGLIPFNGQETDESRRKSTRLRTVQRL
jgi:hypothetical protein